MSKAILLSDGTTYTPPDQPSTLSPDRFPEMDRSPDRNWEFWDRLDTLVVHCSATPPTMWIGAKQIREWHRKRGWHDIGYHWVIMRSGALQSGRDVSIPGAHVAGENGHTHAVCLVGGTAANGKPENNFNVQQMDTLGEFIDTWARAYQFENSNITKVCGHRDFPGVSKSCPCFDVNEFLAARRDSRALADG